MSDFNTPTLGTAYTDVLDDLKARDVSGITMCLANPSNAPVGTMKWNRGSFLFQEWDGATFNTVVISIAGGGTGAITASGARTSLGLGTLATQNSNAVVITGGAVAADLTGSINVPAGAILGTIPQANLGTGSGGTGAKFLADDQTYKAIVSARTFLSKNAGYTVTAADIVAKVMVLLTGTFTITLPTTNNTVIDGLDLILKNISTGTITLTPQGGQTIDGVSSFTIYPAATGLRPSYTLICNKTAGNWEIV